MRDDAIERPTVLVRPWLLLLLAEEPGHGYELKDRLSELGFSWGRGKPGPVYRELHNLETEALIRSTPEERSSGPVRYIYHLTDEGRARLADLCRAMHRLSALSTQFEDRCSHLPPPELP